MSTPRRCRLRFSARLVTSPAMPATGELLGQHGFRRGSLCEPAGVASDTNGNLSIAAIKTTLERLLRFTPPFGLNPRANLVLGQGNFVENQPNSVDSTNYNSQPIGIAVDRSSVPNRLYVADSKNNRVLGYSNAESFQNGEPAAVVIGQKGFTGSSPNQGGSIAANGLDLPSGLAVDGQGNVFVADSKNNRVLRFSRPSSAANSESVSQCCFRPEW